MIYLSLTLVFSLLLFVIFREFSKRNVDTFQAITINYFCAGLMAVLFTDFELSDVSVAIKSSWFIYALSLGIYFIIMFNVMAKTTQLLGVTISSLSSKMSLVIPVFAGFFIQNEEPSILKILAIIMALFSIYLTVTNKDKKNGPIYLAVILFFGGGILDTSLSLIQFYFLESDKELNLFTSIIFFVAFLCGSIILIVKKQKLKKRNIIAGITLGIPNFFSIYFLLKTLNTADSSIIFPILNIGIVTLSALIGWKIYSENLTTKNWTGLILATLSLAILIYS
jgi:drug/metabolite transporter (DMT)-like permease